MTDTLIEKIREHWTTDEKPMSEWRDAPADFAFLLQAYDEQKARIASLEAQLQGRAQDPTQLQQAMEAAEAKK